MRKQSSATSGTSRWLGFRRSAGKLSWRGPVCPRWVIICCFRMILQETTNAFLSSLAINLCHLRLFFARGSVNEPFQVTLLLADAINRPNISVLSRFLTACTCIGLRPRDSACFDFWDWPGIARVSVGTLEFTRERSYCFDGPASSSLYAGARSPVPSMPSARPGAKHFRELSSYPARASDVFQNTSMVLSAHSSSTCENS